MDPYAYKKIILKNFIGHTKKIKTYTDKLNVWLLYSFEIYHLPNSLIDFEGNEKYLSFKEVVT